MTGCLHLYEVAVLLGVTSQKHFQKHQSLQNSWGIEIVVPRPTNPSADHIQGGGSGDFCHVSVFSAGICAEPIVLQIVIQHHAIIQLYSGYLANKWLHLIQFIQIAAATIEGHWKTAGLQTALNPSDIKMPLFIRMCLDMKM